ncbi:NUDIX hydrolase [Phyllobacterium phragmitis]|uniref:NUDIX hydrolase n=2 Tax=Phyllobacterium phragmitis TaxID=2670329 RepID=A0ABQ0GXU9_9HYPH
MGRDVQPFPAGVKPRGMIILMKSGLPIPHARHTPTPMATSHPIIHGVSVICRSKGRFLLVERGRKPWKGWLAFPGGRREADETPEAAARRELREETGLEAEKLTHFATVDLSQDPGSAYEASYYLAVFRAHGVTGEATAADDAAAILWLDIEEMAKTRITQSTLTVAREIVRLEDGTAFA